MSFDAIQMSWNRIEGLSLFTLEPTQRLHFLMNRLWLRMMPPKQDGSAQILEMLMSFVCNGWNRKRHSSYSMRMIHSRHLLVPNQAHPLYWSICDHRRKMICAVFTPTLKAVGRLRLAKSPSFTYLGVLVTTPSQIIQAHIHSAAITASSSCPMPIPWCG